MKTEITNEHRWLHKLVGKWIGEGEAQMGPDTPAQAWKIPEEVSQIGDLWVQGRSEGDFPGCAAATTVMTLGYDPSRKHFVGTFVGSMMTHMWIYEGDLEADGKTLTMRADGPSFTPDGNIVEGKMAKYRDVVAFEDDDTRTLTSFMQTDDGQWMQIMQARYRRQK
ncbi:DUF1579 domain-containing protein [Cupriavidus pauculus]|uniref:DUF1579 domain-containing protein n=1 Tax=Cupriavidus pauculus TaxID=82633 RepID=UPI0007811E09|nr:DUF1579 domain-containing protein [Cupriavidus pauculus]KAB0603533.1 DUF1579 domain-containing protein [Cupriavidus pauculus]MBY4731950.1 DUF1579 domain-containing protein [Cupriavidus pauculus]MCM3605738.1 DUF1579 domain-containing protein [Cupriavidus pauculus]UAL02297.1 DUF1579 domain-containing protein [Cupriavidus pauculus]